MSKITKHEYDNLAIKIEEYISRNHYGGKTGVKMLNLANIFEVTDRVIRDKITAIRLYGKFYIKGSHKGYYAIDNNNVVDNQLVKTTVNSIKRQVAVNPDVLNIFYSEMNKIKQSISVGDHVAGN